MAGQKPYKPNDPPPQPPFVLARGNPMANAPNQPPNQPQSQTQTHEQLRQSARPDPTGPGNLQNILAYFKSQGVADDHVVATIAGFPLRLNELQRSGSTQDQYNPPPPPRDTRQDERKPEERKRPSKTEENDES